MIFAQGNVIMHNVYDTVFFHKASFSLGRYLHHLFPSTDINLLLNAIPTFGIRARTALSCVRGKNAGDYGCYLGVQCRQVPRTQSGMCIGSYQFLPEISSFVMTCTYLFTIDDNHLQKSTLLSSVISHYTGPMISSHYINPSLIIFFLKIWSWNHMQILR